MTNKTPIMAGYTALYSCVIGGVPDNVPAGVNFHVTQIKIMEDHCKPYFTAELTIETYNHSHDYFIYPTSEVTIDFESPSSDSVFKTRRYRESFRIYSHESEQLPEGESQNRIQHRISLMGQEYYNDRHSVVNQMDANLTGTAAAAKIHNNYVRVPDNGGLSVVMPSSGMIGTQKAPHQSSNLKPFTAISDILGRSVWQNVPSCAPVYFRHKGGHKIGPLQNVMDTSPTTMAFTEYPTEGAQAFAFIGTAASYSRIIALKPLAPSGEASSGVRASEVGNLLKTTSFIDMLTGSFNIGGGTDIDKMLKKVNLSRSIPGANQKIRQMLESAGGGKKAGQLFNVMSQVMNARATAKNGPGGFAVSQEAFVTALTYADKFWVTVPGQGGHRVTVGDSIFVNYQMMRNKRAFTQTRKLYIARLIHTIDFTIGKERKPTGNQAQTHLYGVAWG